MLFTPPPNITNSPKTGDFYVSYNPVDVAVYGDTTTALVWGNGEAFYILNGNHRDAYDALFDKGWDACFAYFNDNIDQKNKLSDTGTPAEVKAAFRAALARYPV